VSSLAQESGPPDEEGRITLLCYFESLLQARSHLLSLGPLVEVIEPGELRANIADYATTMACMYGE